jgi:hypothetical protein
MENKVARRLFLYTLKKLKILFCLFKKVHYLFVQSCIYLGEMICFRHFIKAMSRMHSAFVHFIICISTGKFVCRHPDSANLPWDLYYAHIQFSPRKLTITIYCKNRKNFTYIFDGNFCPWYE